jgi:hypothetical protein
MADNHDVSNEGRRDFLRRVKNGSVKLAAAGVGLTAYNNGRSDRIEDLNGQISDELTLRNKQKVQDLLKERSDDAGTKQIISGALAAAGAAGYAAAAAQDKKQSTPMLARTDEPGRKISRREMLARTTETAGVAAVSASIAGVLHVAGGGRELNEIADSLPATLSEPERSAVEKKIVTIADNNEQRLPFLEKILGSGVVGVMAGHVLKPNRVDEDGPKR